MIILLFGPPGCGKGTQASLLAEQLPIPTISTGEMFRAECKAGTELGKQASAIMSAGGLIPDEITNGIVANRIAQPDCAAGFMLDGYPRTVPQAMQFSALLAQRGMPDPVVIHLDASDDFLVARLTARRQCPQCKRIYNLISLPPQDPERCDIDGSLLFTRVDDQEDIIRQRLTAYHQLTGPVLKWYGASSLYKVDSMRTCPDVAADILKLLQSLRTATACAT